MFILVNVQPGQCIDGILVQRAVCAVWSKSDAMSALAKNVKINKLKMVHTVQVGKMSCLISAVEVPFICLTLFSIRY